MLNKNQIDEIKEHIEKAQNPVFFFDNDPDGLCSFLLLYRSSQKGKGVPVKGSAKQMVSYFGKVREFESDYIFILDKPEVSQEFFEKAREINIPVVWIDHHFIEKEKILKDIFYYNPVFNYLENFDKEKKESISGEPVTALCYQITKRKEDLWIAVAGCISDMYLPDYYKEFVKEYPDLGIINFDSVSDIYYKSSLGTIIKIMGNGLKDKTTNVVGMLKFLMKVKSPYEFLDESDKNKTFHKRSKEIEEKKRRLIQKAKNMNINKEDKILFFEYGGDLSVSSDLSNELKYLFPEKVIVVIYNKGDGESNMSIRGTKVREPLARVISDIDSAGGGGHEDAVGVKMNTEDIPFFKKRFSEEFL